MKKIPLLFALLFVSYMNSCKMELSPSNPKEFSPEDLEVFYQNAGYASNITQVLNDSISVFWDASWQDRTIENINDTTQYVYVPLYPQAKNTKSNKIIETKALGVEKYIVIQLGKPNTYFLAQYTSDRKEDGMVLADFTGGATFKNLATGSTSHCTYKNGKRNAKASAMGSNSRTNGCMTFYTCDWYSYDCGVFVTTTTGSGLCPYPSYNPFCTNGVVGSWNISDSQSKTICNDDPMIIVAIPTATFNANYIIAGPEKPINNLSARLDCFLTPRIPGHRYSNKVEIFIDQPVNGSNQLFRIGVNGYRRVGHTYCSLEVLDVTTNTVKRLVFGFYVENEFRAVQGIKTASAWGDDGNTPYDMSLETTVGTLEFNKLVQKLKQMGRPQYHLVDNNCTEMIYDLFENIFSSLPDANQQIANLGVGKTPAQFGQRLKEQYASRPIRNFKLSNGSKSPSSTNCK